MTTDHPEIATAEPEAPPADAPASEPVDLDTPVRTLDGPEYIEVDGVQVPNYDLTIPIFSEGDVVTGRVVRVDKDEVLVDIGYKSEGVIPLPELSIRKSVRPDEEVSLGEMVDALVMQKEDQDGRLILSKKRARFEKAWKRIEAAAAAGEHVEGTVIEVVKGGLILDLGVRGFLPASLVDIRRVQDLDEFLGRKLECKVIELNRNRNNVVLSRRAVLEDERREVRQKILDELQPGKVVEGVISNIVEFGAFVDLDGIDGLIHISELSWSHVNHPSEVLQIGEKVQVKVLDIDRDRQRISLGLKQTQADPWQSVIEAYEVGDVVEGRVTKVVTFGAFVEIHPGVEGLVHISELAAHHVENPREVVNQGDVLAVRIIEIDADRRRLSLSLKRVADSDPVQHRLPDDLRAAALAQAQEAAELSDDGELAEAVDDAIAEAVVEDAVEEAIVEEAIVEEAIVEEAIVEEAIVEEAIVEEAIVEEAIVEEATVEEAIVEEAIVEEAIVEEAVIEEAVAEAAIEEAVIEEAVEEAVIEEAIEEAVAEEAVAEEAVAEAAIEEAVEEAAIEEAVGEAEAAVDEPAAQEAPPDDGTPPGEDDESST